MNALDLRADHPEMLSDYRLDTTQSPWRRVADAVRRALAPIGSRKPVTMR